MNLDELSAFKARIRRPDDSVFLMHPETAAKIDFAIPPGVSVKVNPYVSRYSRKWEFPASPFTEYEASDEEWARPVCFGREVDDPDRPVVYRMNMDLISSLPSPIDMRERDRRWEFGISVFSRPFLGSLA